MNKTILIGRITKDPELKFLPNTGTATTTITLAVDKYNTKTKQKEADFIPVVVWGKQAEALATYTKKGSQIAVVGRIQTRSYEAKDGTKRYVTEVVAQEVEFLGSKKTENAETFKETEEQFKKELNYGEDMEEVDSSDIPF